MNREQLARFYNPDQARNPAGSPDGGQWSSDAGLTHSMVDKLNDPKHGFTYIPMQGGYQKTGYALSIMKEHERVFNHFPSEAEIQAYIDAKKDVIAANRDSGVGGWYDTETGRVVLDVSIVKHTLSEAVSLGLQHNQEGIYDLANDKTIYLRDYAHSLARSASISAERYGEANSRTPKKFAGQVRPQDASTVGASIPDAEIFSIGAWPGENAEGIKFTGADLDAIVASFSALNLAGRVPLKIGHKGADSRYDDTAPALGWVQSVRRVGDKLLADIHLTSQRLVEGIRNGAYKFVSIELLKDVEAGTRRIPWVLDAVALLGASQPAVGTLKDLQSSLQVYRRENRTRFAARVSFKREPLTTNRSKDMEQSEIQALIDKAVAPFKAEVESLKKTERTARVSAHRAAVLAPFEVAIARGDINPAARDKFIKMNSIENDDKVELSSASDAEAFIASVKDMPQFRAAKKPVQSRTGTGQAEGVERFNGHQVGAAVRELVSETAVKLGYKPNDFHGRREAQRLVFANKANAALVAEYFADPQSVFEHKQEVA